MPNSGIAASDGKEWDVTRHSWGMEGMRNGMNEYSHEKEVRSPWLNDECLLNYPRLQVSWQNTRILEDKMNPSLVFQHHSTRRRCY
jgi:hypothetical protein